MEQEEELTTFRHKTPVQLRFNDVDAFGHINNSVYFALYDLAKTEYLRDVSDPDFTRKDIRPVVANVNADFIHPVYYGDNIEIQTAVTHLGNTSFVISQQAIDIDKKRVVCKCRTVMVCFSVSKQAPVTLPDELREQFKKYEGL